MRPTRPHPGFARKFLAALPPDLAATFTEEQILGVQHAFGLRHSGRHPVDLRRSIWTPFGRIYLVVLAGRERRAPQRRSFERLLAGGGRLGGAVLAACVTTTLLLVGLGALHAAKLMLGIDLVPGIDMLPDEALIRALRG